MPYLHKQWLQSGLIAEIPDQMAERFSSASSNNAIRSVRLLAMLNELNTLMEESGVPILVSKGLPVSHACYGDVGLRVYFDIDLQIKKGDKDRALGILQSRGYVPFFTKRQFEREQCLLWQPMPYHWGPDAIYDPDAPCFLELHTKPWEPQWHGFRMECNLDLWNGSRIEQINGISVRVPALEKLLVHLAVHFACNVLETNARLMHLLDLILLMRLHADSLRWDAVQECIDESNTRPFCFLAFDLASRSGSVHVPDNMMMALRNSTPRGIAKWLESRGVEDVGRMDLRQPNQPLIYFLHWNMAAEWGERTKVLFYSLRAPLHEHSGPARWLSLGSRMVGRLKTLARAIQNHTRANSFHSDSSEQLRPPPDPARDTDSMAPPSAKKTARRRLPVQMIFYNTILQSAGKMVSAFLGIITVALMSRYLGKGGFGEYTTIVSFMGFFGVLADLGLYLVMTKKISRPSTDEKAIVGNILALRFVSALLLLTTGAIAALLLQYSGAVKEGMFLAIVAFSFMSGTQLLGGVFQKYLMVYQLVLPEILQRLTMLILVAALIRLEWGLRQFVLALSISFAVHFAVCLWLALRLIDFRLQFDLKLWGEVLEESWPLALSGVLSLIYFRADTLILSIYKPAADVGIYGLPRKIMEVLLVFPSLFGGLIMPFLARFAFSDWKNYRLYLQKSLDAVYLTVVPMLVVTVFFARPIINIVGGSDYGDADAVLRIMICATVFIYVGLLLGYVVVALGAQRAMLWGNLAGSLCGAGLYCWLIPRFSYYGAAASTVIIQIIVCVYAYWITSRKAGFYPSFKAMGKALIAAVPMFFFYRFAAIEWIVEAFVGLAIYSCMLILLRAVPREFIREIFSRGNESFYGQGSEIT